ncbi:MAG TPA: response regulator [Candidatus Nitrosotalea sp.]|nr:response regulator [Candidatus Nitrosotalea sp.]
MRRHSVVVVDDRIEVRELLELRLSMVPGLKVIGQAENGNHAIKIARDLQPDLMTLDLMMPVMGGAEAIPLLRAVAPHMRIVVYTADPGTADLTKGARPDAIVSKGVNLSDLVDVVVGVLAEGPEDLLKIDLGRIPVHVAIEAFDSWVGLYARVREALATKGDESTDLLGNNPVEPADLLCLMGVFMQLGHPLMSASSKKEKAVELTFFVRRGTGVAARRALLALGGNGTLRAFNRVWSHKPSKAAEAALDLVDQRLVDQLPTA